MWASRYSRSYVGKMLLQQLNDQERETTDLAQVSLNIISAINVH